MKTLFLSFLVSIFVACQHSNSNNQLDKLADVDIKLSVPKPGEWMAEHSEKAQSFEQYCNSNPVRVSKKKNTIYIQPIGRFTNSENAIVANTVTYVHLFFGLKTILLTPISEEVISSKNKRMKWDREQLDASYILNKILPKRISKDGIVVMAITAKDLYPSPSWNYVFGLADYEKRTGITSFNRFNDEKEYTLCLNRTLKTAVHEIGHMFSMSHCKHAVCLMNGVNHLPEEDTKPNVLCSECLKKISWNLKFDDTKRLQKLINFLNLNHLEKDALLLQKQLDALK